MRTFNFWSFFYFYKFILKKYIYCSARHPEIPLTIFSTYLLASTFVDDLLVSRLFLLLFQYPLFCISTYFSSSNQFWSTVDNAFVDHLSPTGVQKLTYPETGPASAANSDVQCQVCARVGTPRSNQLFSPLIWKAASIQFIEEPLDNSSILLVRQLGPSYTGHVQALSLSAFQGKWLNFYFKKMMLLLLWFLFYIRFLFTFKLQIQHIFILFFNFW